MKIVNWQKNYTHQQSDTWRAFQETLDEKVLFIVKSFQSPSREKQGWISPDFVDLDFILLQNKNWWEQGKKIIQEYPNAIHVFSGFWGDRRFFPLILYAIWKGSKVCIMQEAYATQAVGYLREERKWISAFKVLWRPLLYKCAFILFKLTNKKAAPCLLAISSQCVAQLRQAGFSRGQIFPFGYFVQKANVGQNRKKKDQPLKLVFVGSLLKRKGIDVLVGAVMKIFRQGYPISLDVYGYGKPEDFFSSSEFIAYKGVIPAEQSQSVIAQYDVLTLPSRHDGWGVVVNEALLQEVPVIVSDHVGAKCLVEAGGAGAVFENENVNALAEVLLRLVQEPELLAEWQARAASTSALILPEVGAKYMYNVLRSYFYNEETELDAVWC